MAITRWSDPAVGPTSDDVELIAGVIGGVVYEVRLKLAGPLPAIVGPLAGLEQARALLGALRGRGHGVVACDASAAGQVVSARTLVFGERALEVTSTQTETFSMEYAELMVIVRAACSLVQETTSGPDRLAVAEAALASGRMRVGITTEASQSTDLHLEQVAYLYRRSGGEPVFLREQRLEYLSLGSELRRTKGENFRAVIGKLVERAPHVAVDERLVNHKRRTSLQRSTASGSVSRKTSSNQAETDLAAHVIALAHHQRQA